MHRHSYQGRKLGRKRDERRRLIKNLATSLVLDESLSTTLPKAKELVPYAEKMIHKAQTGTLQARRQIVSGLLRDDAAMKLVDEIAPQMKRQSGYLRLKKTGWRKGDHAPMAQVSFVDEIKPPVKPDSKVKTSQPKATPKTEKANAKVGKKPIAKTANKEVKK